MARMPGNMNVLKSTPPLEETSEERPVPSTSRKSTGWTSDVTSRSRLRRKRSSSRLHTTRTARASSLIHPDVLSAGG
jgi:hypothetical protein